MHMFLDPSSELMIIHHSAPRLPFSPSLSLLPVSSRGPNARCNVYVILDKRALVEKVPGIGDCISNLYRILEERDVFRILSIQLYPSILLYCTVRQSKHCQ